jgi:hypothetical protein
MYLPGQAWAGVGIAITPTDWDMVWWAVARQTGICRVQAPQWSYFTLLLPARDLTSITAAYVAVYVEPHTMLCNRQIGTAAGTALLDKAVILIFTNPQLISHDIRRAHIIWVLDYSIVVH